MKHVLFVFFVACSLVLSSCGGGGGGGDSFAGAGKVRLSIQPSKIDVGDRVRVTIVISEVNEDGIALKIHFPDALSYVVDTSILKVDGKPFDIGPSKNVAGNENDRYLVYFLSRSDFNDNADGTLQFELKGEDGVSGDIDVDIDVDDPTIPNSEEFLVADPQFQVADGAQVEVIN